MCHFKPFLILLFFLLFSGCCTLAGSKSTEPKLSEEKCDANGLPNAELVISSSCALFVRTDKVCVYDEYGRIKETTTRPSGACLCMGF